MASISLVRVVVLVCQGELLFLWGVVLYSLFWYCARGNGKIARWTRGIIQALAKLATTCFCLFKWTWPITKRVTIWMWPYALLFGTVGLTLLAFLHTDETDRLSSRSNAVSTAHYPSAAPGYNNAMLRAPVPVTACPAPGHSAYSYEHESNLLNDINDLLRPIDHNLLSDAATKNDKKSRQLISAKDKVRQSLVFLRNTVIPDWINKQRQEMHQPHHETVQAAVSNLQKHHESCMLASAGTLGDSGSVGVLAHVIGGIRHEVQLALAQDAQHSQATRARKLLDQASKSLILLRDMLAGDACYSTHVNALIRDWHLVSRNASPVGEQDLQDMERLRSHWPVVTTGLRPAFITGHVADTTG